jgi:hypothetical protein
VFFQMQNEPFHVQHHVSALRHQHVLRAWMHLARTATATSEVTCDEGPQDSSTTPIRS